MRSWLILLRASLGAALVLLTSASLALSASPPPSAETEQAFNLCERATARWERLSEIPAHLLQAISLAESGRWSETDKRVRAWPWTVTSGGPGSYFASKAEAMAEVRRLQEEGIENIDVGCMQVNMQYHGHNFTSVEHAMDPDINAAYAAKFLTSLRADADSWGEAAGFYHSTTPSRTAYYRSKVEKFLAGLNKNPSPQTELAAFESAAVPDLPRIAVAPIDRARMAELNERFKTLKTAARQMREDLDPAARRERQMAAWRTASGRAASIQMLLAERRAELAKRRTDKLQDAFKSDPKERFAENRQRQLVQWRERFASAEPPTIQAPN